MRYIYTSNVLPALVEMLHNSGAPGSFDPDVNWQWINQQSITILVVSILETSGIANKTILHVTKEMKLELSEYCSTHKHVRFLVSFFWPTFVAAGSASLSFINKLKVPAYVTSSGPERRWDVVLWNHGRDGTRTGRDVLNIVGNDIFPVPCMATSPYCLCILGVYTLIHILECFQIFVTSPSGIKHFTHTANLKLASSYKLYWTTIFAISDYSSTESSGSIYIKRSHEPFFFFT